jgi:hypothetical protein
MKRIPKLSICAWLVVGALVCVFTVAGVCVAQEAKGLAVDTYIAQGYSAIGPITVESVSSKSLVLFAVPKNLARQGISLTQLKKQQSVYVFQKSKEVIVYTLTAKEVRNDT